MRSLAIAADGLVLRAVSADVVDRIARGVHEVAPAARVAVCPSEPIVGAALLGLDELGADAGAVTRARAELDIAVAELAPAVSVAAVDRRLAGLRQRRPGEHAARP